MKSIVLPDQKTEGPCETCNCFVPATWRYGIQTLEDGVEIENVMLAYCDTCDQVVAVSGQSVHAVKQALENRRVHRTKVRLPRLLVDFVGVELSRAGVDPTDFDLYFKALFMASLDTPPPTLADMVQASLDDPVLQLPLDETVNVTLSHHVEQMLARLGRRPGLDANESIRALLVVADGALTDAVARIWSPWEKYTHR